MDDHSDNIRRRLTQRIEVYAGAGRKQWPDDLKARIVAESLEPGAAVTDIARRHGCRPQQVHDWRRRARLGQLVLPAAAGALSFVPLVSGSSPSAGGPPPPSPGRSRVAGGGPGGPGEGGGGPRPSVPGGVV